MICKKQKLILVIDDDEIFRRRLSRAFRDRNYEVLEAANTGQALEHLSRDNIELVVLDLRLGEESGLSLLKTVSTITDAKVVVLTGYGTIATAVDAVKLGAVNYLTKPVDADTILESFENIRPGNNPSIKTPPLAQVEWDHIQRVVNDHKGNISRASKALGLHRRSLQRKLAKNPAKLS